MEVLGSGDKIIAFCKNIVYRDEGGEPFIHD